VTADRARHFVALPIPVQIARPLVATQPAAADGVRLLDVSELHLTLHFLGTFETARARAALASVRAGCFEVVLTAPGTFGSRGKRTILWYGVAGSPGLLALHAAVGQALTTVGYRPESRRYFPHITLARLGAAAPRGIASAFAELTALPGPPAFTCRSFALYVSETLRAGARYTIVETYPLG
jgi:2'-5' RNA ligase